MSMHLKPYRSTTNANKILKNFLKVEQQLQDYIKSNNDKVQDNVNIQNDAQKRIDTLQSDNKDAQAVLNNLQKLLDTTEA